MQNKTNQINYNTCHNETNSAIITKKVLIWDVINCLALSMIRKECLNVHLSRKTINIVV